MKKRQTQTVLECRGGEEECSIHRLQMCGLDILGATGAGQDEKVQFMTCTMGENVDSSGRNVSKLFSLFCTFCTHIQGEHVLMKS